MALFFVWRHMVTPSLVDHYRDQLFDLRSEVREHFAALPEGLGSSDYRSLRDMINSHILYIEKVSVFALGHMLALSESSHDVRDAFKSTAEMSLEGLEQRTYCQQTRGRAAKIVFEYASRASLATWVLAVVIIPVVVLAPLFRDGAKALRAVPKFEFARVVVVVLSLVGLQGKFKPTVESVIARAAAENAKQQASNTRASFT